MMEIQHRLEAEIWHPITLLGKHHRVRSLRKFPWMVCYYADRDWVPRRRADLKYGPSQVPPNIWFAHGVRIWKLADVKRFASLRQASKSGSYNRTYYPFCDTNGITVLMHCTRVRETITEYQLGRSYPNG